MKVSVLSKKIPFSVTMQVFQFLLCLRIFLIRVEFNIDLRNREIHAAVCSKVVAVRTAVTDKRRIRSFPFCEVIVGKGKYPAPPEW
jgi:hypothetical protein